MLDDTRTDRSAEIAEMLGKLSHHFNATPRFSPPYACHDCGRPVKALAYSTGRRELVDANTSERHYCPAKPRNRTIEEPPPPARPESKPRPPDPRPPERPKANDIILF